MFMIEEQNFLRMKKTLINSNSIYLRKSIASKKVYPWRINKIHKQLRKSCVEIHLFRNRDIVRSL